MPNKHRINIELQHFEECPNCPELRRRVSEALKGREQFVDYQETLVETIELAQKIKFRGSPTLLINGDDFEEAPEPAEASLACRYYGNGLPTVEAIRERIDSLISGLGR